MAEEVFIAYEDDTDKTVRAWVKLLSTSDGLVTFETTSNHGTNIITIPTHRVLKIKKKGDDIRLDKKNTTTS